MCNRLVFFHNNKTKLSFTTNSAWYRSTIMHLMRTKYRECSYSVVLLHQSDLSAEYSEADVHACCSDTDGKVNQEKMNRKHRNRNLSVALLFLMSPPQLKTFYTSDCFYRSSVQEPEKEVSDWLSDLTLVDQHLNLEVHMLFVSVSSSFIKLWSLLKIIVLLIRKSKSSQTRWIMYKVWNQKTAHEILTFEDFRKQEP